ncbi:MAG: hypothetical protein RLZZ524_511, partial [Pseudomonadota bacterium]
DRRRVTAPIEPNAPNVPTPQEQP